MAQIRLQILQGADGTERFVVHAPPAQGALLWS